MNEEDLHAALMAVAETITGYPMLWPQKGGDAPTGEHIRVNHLPNDNDRFLMCGDGPVRRMGFLVLMLVSPLGVYEAVTKKKAGDIAAIFPNGLAILNDIRVRNTSIRAGRQDGVMWETPIWIEYQGIA